MNTGTFVANCYVVAVKAIYVGSAFFASTLTNYITLHIYEAYRSYP